MKREIVVIFNAVMIASAMVSCAPALYTNVGQNVPLFRKKGEVAMSAGHGSASGENYLTSSTAEGFSGQAAVAIGKSTAIISSFYSLKDEGEDINGNGNYFEVGIGKFSYSETSKLHGEIFIGTGFGSIKNSEEGEYINLKYVKPFIQPSLGFSSPYFDIAITPRIALVSYTGKSENISEANEQRAFENFWQENKNTIVFEPGFTARAGYKNVKLQLQYSHTSFKYSWPDDTNSYSAVLDDFFSIGLFVLISDRWSKNK